ncbi:MAG TPA: acyltransferase [Steroidobacteraceae bacterium]|jgi:peptidoglycan/LPS O-acetylase OafA/YrhL|nr:acyltransferase [Steroidobacteraceae bacterium]
MQGRSDRFNEIDLLRFIAAASVLLFHYTFYCWLPSAENPFSSIGTFARYGYLGVRLFFIISGFVILMTAARGSLRNFFVSRIVRLYPAFWACCTITFLVTLGVLGAHRGSWTQYLVNMTMTSGFVGVPPIDGAYWSLFVEMRFYALVAVILFLGRIERTEPILCGWLLITIVLAFLAPSTIIRVLQVTLITSFAAYFIAGAAFYLISSQGLTVTRIIIVIVAWACGLAQAAQELPALSGQYHATLSAVVVCSTISVFFVLMFFISTGRTGALGRQKWVLAGALTYPLYLIHSKIGDLVIHALFPVRYPFLMLCGMVAVALTVAYGTHVLVERRYGPKLKKTLNSLLDRLQTGIGRDLPERKSIVGNDPPPHAISATLNASAPSCQKRPL